MNDRDYDDLKARQVTVEAELGKALVEIVVLKKYAEEAKEKAEEAENKMAAYRLEIAFISKEN